MQLAGGVMRPRIAVIGSINIDLVWRTPRMPALGETITGTEFRQIPGGKGANQAVAAARQGAAVSFIGVVGSDRFGEGALRCLVDEGIGIADVTTASGMPTGTAGIFVDADGGNSIVLAPGANAMLSVPHVEAAAATIAAAGFLVCQLETPMAGVVHAFELARQSDVRIVFNPAPVQPLSDAMLACVDYLIVNETEAAQLSGLEAGDEVGALRAAKKILQRGVGAVLLTMGERGVLVATADHKLFIAAVVVPVVDTTCAGDTFVGAFTAALARGLDIADAAIEASYAAALAVTRIGAQTSIPTRAETLELIRSRGRSSSSV
jgi:ribokinase